MVQKIFSLDYSIVIDVVAAVRDSFGRDCHFCFINRSVEEHFFGTISNELKLVREIKISLIFRLNVNPG